MHVAPPANDLVAQNGSLEGRLTVKTAIDRSTEKKEGKTWRRQPLAISGTHWDAQVTLPCFLYTIYPIYSTFYPSIFLAFVFLGLLARKFCDSFFGHFLHKTKRPGIQIVESMSASGHHYNEEVLSLFVLLSFQNASFLTQARFLCTLLINKKQ